MDAMEMVTGNKDSGQKPKKPKKLTESSVFKKPEGMHRELYALICNDYNRDPATLTPTDQASGYKQSKAMIGRSKVRQWGRMPFTNPARSDDLVLHHYRRLADEKQEYPFAKFGKAQNHYHYTDEEYSLHLADDESKQDWSREEVDHLFDLSRRFDQRFVVMWDRWDRDSFPGRCMEDLKCKYYTAVTKLLKARTPPGDECKDLPLPYDAEHEKRRKEQLDKLQKRTEDEIDEEEMLVSELKKIEGRKKEREKKSQDYSKLISSACESSSKQSSLSSSSMSSSLTSDSKAAMTTTEIMNLGTSQSMTSSSLQRSPTNKADKKDKRQGKKNRKRRTSQSLDLKPLKDQPSIKFPDIKGTGVFLRSSKLKMPASVGTKKSKAVEQLLDELHVEVVPMPTETICTNFNELRNQLLLLYELRQALVTSEYELQTLRHRYELSTGKQISDLLGYSLDDSTASDTSNEPTTVGTNLLIDSVAPLNVSSRKRRTAAALLENNPWKKVRKT